MAAATKYEYRVARPRTAQTSDPTGKTIQIEYLTDWIDNGLNQSVTLEHVEPFIGDISGHSRRFVLEGSDFSRPPGNRDFLRWRLSNVFYNLGPELCTPNDSGPGNFQGVSMDSDGIINAFFARAPRPQLSALAVQYGSFSLSAGNGSFGARWSDATIGDGFMRFTSSPALFNSVTDGSSGAVWLQGANLIIPDTWYRIEVRGVNDDGPGPISIDWAKTAAA